MKNTIYGVYCGMTRVFFLKTTVSGIYYILHKMCASMLTVYAIYCDFILKRQGIHSHRFIIFTNFSCAYLGLGSTIFCMLVDMT